jgi:hypothetical protein
MLLVSLSPQTFEKNHVNMLVVTDWEVQGCVCSQQRDICAEFHENTEVVSRPTSRDWHVYMMLCHIVFIIKMLNTDPQDSEQKKVTAGC